MQHVRQAMAVLGYCFGACAKLQLVNCGQGGIINGSSDPDDSLQDLPEEPASMVVLVHFCFLRPL